ncbi:MAG: glycosyltransferase family 4 protein [Flavobacteriales bacterium]|nr:glycosyltransferase family 4 protein [Flavobacteriales bacterium]MCB9166343.1 glycosyltransferase family 4 protein [Flavobacteriales bacterium]MCB9170776.1 glycosyltransferase family 4 protein [Flavobacteriales bacterium]
MSKLHVVLCTDGVFPQAMGGMQRHSRLLAEHLARTGEVELTVLHPHEPPIFDPALGIREVHVHDIDKDKFYLRELKRYSTRIARELDELKPDLILSQGFCVWEDIARSRDRLIVHPHGLEMFQMLTAKERLLGWPFRRALRSILRRSRVAISLGGRLTDILREQVKGSPCEVVVLPNAVDLPTAISSKPPVPSTNRVDEHGGPDERPTINLLFVGRFAFNKGLDVLMAVAERLVKNGLGERVHFQLAGDGPLLKKYQDDGLPPNVRLLGRVDDAQLDRLYRSCDAFVLPTRFEGMPTVVLEAMARAKPIIVSDVGATSELVTPHNGYLLPPGDACALYDAIISFAERGAEVHARMGRYSHERVVERFSWPSVTKEYLALFQRLVAQGR